MSNLKPSIFRQVLTIGPDFKEHRGGIGAVIATYSSNVPEFNFVASYHSQKSKWSNFLAYARCLLVVSSILFFSRRIRVIHIHSASRGSFLRKYFIFILGKYIFRRRVVFHLHGGKFHLFVENSGAITKYVISHLFHRVDIVICLSNYWKNFVKSHFDIEHVAVLANPIEIPIKTCLRPQPHRLSLLFLGRIGDNKGIFDLLSVLKCNRGYYEGKLYLTIGGDGEIERLKNYIIKHRLTNIVGYQGWVIGKQKDSLLKECDMLILPSYNEGVPISILEAMSYGKAILATQVGGIPESVRDGIDGFLIPPGDKELLAVKIRFAIENRTRIVEMGQAAREYVGRFSIENVVTELNSIYQNLLNKR